MSQRKKLQHFAEMKAWPHVFEPELHGVSDLAGSWRRQGALGSADEAGAGRARVILELACGRGIYTLALARRFAEASVIGVDIKGSRMWHGARVALDEALPNALFLRCRIEDLAEHFAPGEVDEIWITFPDPHPRKGKAKKRLTSPRFLEIYKRLLRPGGRVILKTDHEGLYDYTLESVPEFGGRVLLSVPDVYDEEVRFENVVGDDSGLRELLQQVQTPFERRHLSEGRTIRVVCFSLSE